MAKILAVDDDPSIRYIVKRLLENAGHEVSEASGGNDCLDKLEDERPDLVLLDVMMPDMMGFEVLDEIRKMEHPVPVVMMTVVESPDTMEPENFQGLVDYINKPFDEKDLVQRVNDALALVSI
jgi:CheY-like chemotaxis protein